MFAILNKSHRKTKPNMCETLRQYSDFYSPSVALSLEATHSYRGHECILSFFLKMLYSRQKEGSCGVDSKYNVIEKHVSSSKQCGSLMCFV